ncbi:Dam family site-specific DNA-(adenine-N6)-methyltransferase [Psychromonas sp. SP041]|uniref:DNA adenine methylase n=1 Tax=Psychromonas sp. SP041 TaxID=1365007 RepID=UPI0004728257|nr:Dam family site-specific DNA-(adenine-N6)-methyltransferase [Psychromonas sp. SP041]
MNDSNIVRNKFQEPMLKQVGGKRWARDFIYEFWKKNGSSVLVEPFAGGIASILACSPQKAYAFDTNIHLVNFYNKVRTGLIIDMPTNNNSEYYYMARDRFNHLIREGKDDSEAAAKLYYYLNKTCYNGLMRFNRKGFYNTPFGSYKNLQYKEHFLNEQDAIQNIEFLSCDFRDIPVEIMPEDTTWVIDPPYYGTSFDYGLCKFTWEDQLESIEWAAKLKGPVLYTNTADPEIIKNLKRLGFKTQIVLKKHTVGASSESRKEFKEVFAWKNAELPDMYPEGSDWKKTMKKRSALAKKIK